MTGIEEILISSVAQAVIAIVAEDLAQRPGLAGLREKLQGESPEKLALQRAITRAFGTFAQAHPQMADSLFDKHFLNKPEVHKELAKLLTRHQLPDTKQLSDLWKAQIGAEISGSVDPSITAFLDALSSEIKSQVALGDIVDGRNLEQILLRQNDQVALQTDIRDTLHEMLELIKQRPDWKADAAQAALPRSSAISALHITDPEDVPERAAKLFGRDDLLTQIAAQLTGNDPLLLQGFGGMGKTALAAQAAFNWLTTNKGGVLWLKVGSAPAENLFEALASPLGMAQDIARETGDARIKAMRGLLRRVGVKLLVLDDCWNGAALTELLKAVPSDLAVLLTARRSYGIRQTIKVDALPSDQAVELLSYHAARDLNTDPAAHNLCKQLGYLPFALRIAGINLQAKYHLTPAELSQRIDHTAHDMTVPLDFTEDGRENVASLLKVSLNAPDLNDEARAVFRAFGAFFAPSLTAEILTRYMQMPQTQWINLENGDSWPMKVVANVPIEINSESTQRTLTTLEQHGLIEFISAAENARAYYRLHDLAYSYAAAQNTATEHYQALDTCLAYLERYKQPNLANFAAIRPELDNLLKAADWAFQVGRYADVETFPQHLYFGDGSGGFLIKQGFSILALGLLSQAAEAAARQGNKQGQGVHLGNLGTAYRNLGQTERAIDYHQQALALARDILDKRNESYTLGNLGNTYSALGQTERAIQYYEQVLTIAREMGDKHSEGNALGNLGTAYSALGQTERAIDYHQQALVISREIGDKHSEGNALGNLGLAYSALGQTEHAIDYHQQALVISREIGDKHSEGQDLGNLGLAYSALGQIERAMTYYQQSIAIKQAIGDRMGEATTLNNIGNIYNDQGDYPQAITYYESARAIFATIGAVHLVAKVDGNLADTRAKMSDASDNTQP